MGKEVHLRAVDLAPQQRARHQPEATLSTILGEQAPRRTRMGKYLWMAVLAVAIVLAAAWAWNSWAGTEAYSYTTQKVVKGDLTVIVTATGTVQPVAQVDVSTAVSGIIHKVNVDYNSVVRKGDTLAELDTEILQSNLAGAKARLAVAKANVAKAKAAASAALATYNRQATLSAKHINSTQNLEDAKLALDSNEAALDAAEAEVLAAEAELHLTQTNLSRTIITSPIDGIVLTRNIDEGSTVAASLAAPVLFSIAGDLKEMEVQVDVDEADIGNVKVGQSASFIVDAYPGRTFSAEITDIRFVSETVNNVVTYKALLKVDNADLLLRPGMTATADIVVKTVTSALLAPNAALRYAPPEESASSSGLLGGLFRPPNMKAATTAESKGGSKSLWVMRNSVPTEVKVEAGDTDGQNTVISSGEVVAGDELVTDAVATE